eukprot:CAMPEP_0117422154 /NCGR_PEP_ID=MMETSP0758-20121206/3051_1 /TAXON_ID=63605 /ORGANISM="Percolomonas cosmopolitus, Strain AE-1 (ATCC 50343)" /LENGTH=89 /DNA_ID=CAMNT_0005204605 /DNA_START=450 /DNA_END=716 /DNA_ORIENTATION=-
MEKLFGFLTHTTLINKCKIPISWIFVTPSAHRGHHAGRPSKYLDKNYGEMFTIYDRLFGTFQEEYEPIVFGHINPIKSWDPVEAQLLGW